MQRKDRKSKKMVFRVIQIFCICIFFTLWMPDKVHAEKPEKIRVGLYNPEIHYAPGKEITPIGYDYEYLTRIAVHTGWKYEYVTASLDECLDMLQQGKIDLLCGIEKTREREKALSYCDTATMFVSSCLLQSEKEPRYAFEDFESFDGMRIGTVRSSSMIHNLQQYSEENGFSYELLEYGTDEAVKRALDMGEIDAACLESNQNLSRFSVIAYFGYSPRYCVSSPMRPELAQQLDEVLKQIWVEDPKFEYEMFEKYFGYDHNIAFTREEQEYLAEHTEPISVGLYMDIGRLLCRYDEENGEYCGIVVDIMELISESTGLTFRYEEIPEGDTPGNYLRKHPDSIVAPSLINSLISHDSGYLHLNPIIKGRMLTVTRIGEKVDLSGNFRLALPGGVHKQADLLREVFPNAELIYCTKHRDCLDMVASGKAEAALCNEITAAYQLQSPLRKNLQTSRLADIKEDLTLGLSYDADAELVSVLNKVIASIGERDARQIVVNNTASVSYVMNFREWTYKNRVNLGLFILLVSIIMFLYYRILKYRRYREWKSRELQQAEERLKVEHEYQEKLYQQAYYDELTGLYNEKHFIEKADGLLKQNPDRVYTFMQINLVKFKMQNDLYGVNAGDKILCTVADRLREAVGKQGHYGRLYADHFVVCTSMEMESLENSGWDNGVLMVEYKGIKIRVELNVGVYVDELHCQDIVQALDFAKIALENESETEKGYLHYFKMENLETLRVRQRITNEMEAALTEEQFQVYLQPQFDIVSNCLVGAEALVRWIRPDGEIVSPGEFIPVFEQNGFIYKLDAYVCDKICAILAEWIARGKMVPISVNLSRQDLKNPDLSSMLQRSLKKYGVPVSLLHLEITETAYFDDRDMIKKVVDDLHDLGFCIEMDDFGKGYSSLSMLKEIPVDILKMDMKFLEGEDQMKRGSMILRSMIDLAYSVEMAVIVEGVETEDQMRFLRSIKCRFIQGYLMGRPVPVLDFEKIMESNRIGGKRLD